MTQAITLLVDRTVESGDIAKGAVEPIDLLRALVGVSMAGAGPNWPDAAKRMVDVLLSGLTAR